MEATSLNAALNRLHDKLGERCRRFTPHDLRSTARSHLGALGVDDLIAERCLNHSLGSNSKCGHAPCTLSGAQ